MTIETVKRTIEECVIGKINADHTEEGHFYVFADTGTRVKSVTTKLIIRKDHLIPWAVEKGIEWLELVPERWDKLKGPQRVEYITGAKFAYTEVRDDAGGVGSKGHSVIENYINAWIAGTKIADIRTLIEQSEDFRVFGVARAGEAVIARFPIVPVASELLVGWEPWNSAGTLDLLVWNTEEECLELWDWKSSNQVNQDAYPMQIAAYKRFFEKMTGLKIKRCRLIHLDKFSDKFHVYTLLDPMRAFNAFRHISQVYDWMYDGKVKLLEDKKRITI